MDRFFPVRMPWISRPNSEPRTWRQREPTLKARREGEINILICALLLVRRPVKRDLPGLHYTVSVYSPELVAKPGIQTVLSSGGVNIHRELIHHGYAVFRGDLGGAEHQAMHGRMRKLFGKYAEALFSIHNPANTKLALERTGLSQYIQEEAVGTRMRRWDRPIHDFLMPCLRGTVTLFTGEDVIPREVRHRRDLDTLTVKLKTRSPAPLCVPKCRISNPPPSLLHLGAATTQHAAGNGHFSGDVLLLNAGLSLHTVLKP